MTRTRQVSAAERVAGFCLVALALGSAVGGFALRRFATNGIAQILATGLVPWMVTVASAATPLPRAAPDDAGIVSESEEAPLTPGQAAAASVNQFARAVWSDREGDPRRSMTPTMRQALSEDRLAEIRAALTTANGDFVRLETAWHEDDVQGYRRFRVPVVFARETLDMRVVMDSNLEVAGLFFVEHVPPRDEDDAEAPVKEIELLVGGVETGLPGTLSIPSGPGPFPAAVLVHGSGPNDRDETVGPNKPFRDLAWGLAARGVVVLRYDKRSLARPDSLIANGAGLTVREEVIDDARLALARLRERPEVDRKKVFVVGHSLGGALAPSIAEASPRPAGMVVLAGSTLPLPEKMLEQLRYIAALDGNVSAEEQRRVEEVSSDVERLRRALTGDSPAPDGPILGAPVGYFEDLERRDPPAQALELGLPILVLQGGRDYQVTLEDFARWRSALDGRPGACLVVHDRLDHLLREGEGLSGPTDYESPGHVAEAVVELVADWIRNGRCPDVDTAETPTK